MIPLVGFLPAHDPRVRGTIEAIERDLVDGGFVLRYRTKDTGDVDGLTGREGAFLACSFWLADCLSMLGRDHDARRLLERLIGLRNDLGLLSEEYDPVAGRLVGNFPQAFSHVSLVNSASKIAGQEKPSAQHMMTGLAQRVVARGRGRGGALHHSGAAARDMLSTLAQNADPTTQRSAARAIQAAMAGPPPAGAHRRPTAKRAPAKKAPVKRAVAKKAPAKKASAKQATAKKATAKQATAKKTTAKKTTAKRAQAKRTSAKRAGSHNRTAKAARNPRARRSR
jgi:hypothetical protein